MQPLILPPSNSTSPATQLLPSLEMLLPYISPAGLTFPLTTVFIMKTTTIVPEHPISLKFSSISETFRFYQQ